MIDHTLAQSLAREAVALGDKATPGPWTLNGNALAPVRWPKEANHLSDVALAYRNIELDDNKYEDTVAALVFCAFTRTALPTVATAYLDLVEKVRLLLDAFDSDDPYSEDAHEILNGLTTILSPKAEVKRGE